MANDTKNYPPRWEFIDELIDGARFGSGTVANAMGFRDIQSLRRFGARYRLARSFDGLLLRGYSDDTAEGYRALMGVFLAWSAFEYLCEAVGCGRVEMVAPHEPDRYVQSIRAIDPDYRFYRFISDCVDGRHRKHLRRFFAADPEKPCPITFLASSIRHAFAHGPLTPGAQKVPADVVPQICGILRSFHLNVMAADFQQRVENVERALSWEPWRSK